VSKTATKPHVIVVAGPNGAGKSTSAPYFLRDALEVTEFVNADAIAGGLSAFSPESVAIAAGRIMLERMRELAADRTDFAFETTLAGRGLARFLADLQSKGYHVHVLFLGLESADLAVARVAERVRLGGHDVPVDTIRRRYDQGLRNFFRLYMPMADSWQYFDNSHLTLPSLLAERTREGHVSVIDEATWCILEEAYDG
jgi:predicted ABC-type ATPase